MRQTLQLFDYLATQEDAVVSTMQMIWY
jgi:hypothetical protein